MFNSIPPCKRHIVLRLFSVLAALLLCSCVDPYVQQRQQQALQHRQQQEARNAGENSADGPWVPHVRTLTIGNAEAAGQSDGFNVVTQYVVRFAYTGGNNYEMQSGLQDFKNTALAGYDMLAAKYNIDTNVYSAYRRGWISGFDANARTATLTTN